MDAQFPDIEQLQAFFEAAPHGVIAVNTARCIVAVNPRLVAMFGYAQRDDLVGAVFDVLIPERYRKQHNRFFRHFFMDPHARPMGTGRDLIGKRKNGIEFPVEIGLNFVYMPDGDLALATIVDITERKRLEQNERLFLLAQSQIRLFEKLEIAAAVIQHDGRILSTNKIFEAVRLRYVLGTERLEFFNRRANSFYIQALKASIRSGTQLHFCVPPADDQVAAMVRLMPVLEEGAETSKSQQLIILVLKPIGIEHSPSVDVLKEVFGLTSAEAAVAVQCASGHRIKQVAEKRGVSRETIRTELAHVFTKVGVSSQTQLASLLATISMT